MSVYGLREALTDCLVAVNAFFGVGCGVTMQFIRAGVTALLRVYQREITFSLALARATVPLLLHSCDVVSVLLWRKPMGRVASSRCCG